MPPGPKPGVLRGIDFLCPRGQGLWTWAQGSLSAEEAGKAGPGGVAEEQGQDIGLDPA